MPDNENGENGRPKRYNKPNWRPFFLAELERTNSLKMALDKAQISHQTLGRYRTAHPEFVQEMRLAKDNAVDRVEGCVHLRCLHGDKVKKFDREGREYFEQSFPDALIVAYLKANRPEKWHRGQQDSRASQPQTAVPRVIMLPELEKAEQ